ncbi:hypothetical protein Lepto782_08740 [Leptospira interrogans serovar Canicola]|uniref:Uncharacterized protein n=1 Tax=Leptospira interrogans serovar Canicola TaxID=211880 RepID=A0AAP9WF02_LEPIR|nr:hypothetical protein LeptoLang_08110 [Leptospira interrogans serovar Icterohaemorrhagiae]QOI44488.1 hypothetical protein Lepto782_08740 [Leptospira interrogans serovar Canicola]
MKHAANYPGFYAKTRLIIIELLKNSIVEFNKNYFNRQFPYWRINFSTTLIKIYDTQFYRISNRDSANF